MSHRTWIVSPCYFDVEAYLRVRQETRSALAPILGAENLTFVLVDDSAGQDPAVRARLTGAPNGVEVVVPPYNLGPQEALVFALRGLGPRVAEGDFVVTIDSDGEDRPADIPKLLAPLLKDEANLRKVAVACRTRRHEGPMFRICYALYKPLFRLLTGTIVRNGTFAAYRGWLLKEVIYHPDFDHCYSSAFVSLPVGIDGIPIERGTRYAGRPRMRFLRLAIHGLRMLMPFGEKIAVRGILAASGSFALSLLLLLAGLLAPHPPSRGFFLATSAAALLLLLLACFFALLFVFFTQARSRTLRRLYPDKVPSR